MCGIAGVAGDVRTEDRQIIRDMCAAMRHRGPDDEGYFDTNGASIGMRRLSIIDVDHGHQPVFGESDAVAAVINGEIYNFEDLQELLRARGHVLRSHADSECVPHLYEEFGKHLVDQLRGMFALAVWDARDQVLTLARDRVGKKPLFYAHVGDRLWFASELKCLLQVPEIPRELDLAALDSYLTYQYIPHPMSAIKAIRKVPPAHTLTFAVGHGTVRLDEYWRLSYPKIDAQPSESAADLQEKLRSHLLDATRIRMTSERPLGAYLSGGLDSSAVVAAMSRVTSKPVSTFSVGFEDERFNELPFARRVAEQYGTNHHELIVKPNVQEILPRIARMFDEPFADSSAVPSYYVAEMASRNVVVALTGDGGDESFGGYSRYLSFLRGLPRLSVPPALAEFSAKAADRFDRLNLHNPTLRRVASLAIQGSAPTPALRFGRMVSYFSPEQRSRLLRPEVSVALAGVDPFEPLIKAWERPADADPVNRMLAADVALYLPGDLLPKVDITTMAVSLEARSPLLDHEFMEWSASLPGNLKVADGSSKTLFKAALEPWLPHDLVHRKKMGFSIPRDDWLRGPLRGMVHDLLLSASTRSADYLRATEIDYWVRRNDTFGDAGPQVWALLMLELWFQEVFVR